MVSCNKFGKNFKRVQIFFQNHLVFILVKATKTDDGVVLRSVAHPITKTAGNDCRNELSPQCGHSRKSADTVCAKCDQINHWDFLRGICCDVFNPFLSSISNKFI